MYRCSLGIAPLAVARCLLVFWQAAIKYYALVLRFVGMTLFSSSFRCAVGRVKH